MKKITMLVVLLSLNLFTFGCSTPAEKKAEAEKKIIDSNAEEQKASADANAKVGDAAQDAAKTEAKTDAKAEQTKAEAAQDFQKAACATEVIPVASLLNAIGQASGAGESVCRRIRCRANESRAALSLADKDLRLENGGMLGLFTNRSPFSGTQLGLWKLQPKSAQNLPPPVRIVAYAEFALDQLGHARTSPRLVGIIGSERPYQQVHPTPLLLKRKSRRSTGVGLGCQRCIAAGFPSLFPTHDRRAMHRRSRLLQCSERSQAARSRSVTGSFAVSYGAVGRSDQFRITLWVTVARNRILPPKEASRKPLRIHGLHSTPCGTRTYNPSD